MKKKLIFCIIVIFVTFQTMSSQNVRLVRTDCDSSRSAFITAGYLFGFDVVADSITNVYRVLCEIDYNNIDFIQYSGWQAKPFGSNTYIFPNPQVDSLAKTGEIAVVALLSEANENIYYNNPNIIHFDFVVSQTAKHNSKTSFLVKNIKAYININGLDTIVDINPVSYIYTTHGYIEIWPGDANNDGVVNNNDFYTITNLLGQGSAIKSSKSFKREPASTLWIAQKVLAWDSAAAAYADCDGNGDVTPLDMLIVFLNFNKIHIVSPLVVPVVDNNDFKNANMLLSEFPKDSKLFPIKISTTKPIIGVVAKVSYNILSEACCPLVSNGEIFNSSSSELFIDDHPENGYFNVIIGTKDSEEKINGSGVLFNIVVSNENLFPIENMYNIEDITGITDQGEIIKLDASTIADVSVKSNNYEISVFEIDGRLILMDKSEEVFEGKISVFNSIGECIIFDKNFVKTSDETQIELPTKLPSGRYFTVIKNSIKILAIPFSIVH